MRNTWRVVPRAASENGVNTLPPGRETTGELNEQLLRVVDSGEVTPADADGALRMSSDDFINRIADRVFEKMVVTGGPPPPGGSGGSDGTPPGPPRHTFLGVDVGWWMRTAVGWTVAILLAIGAWWLTVRDTLKNAASQSHVEKRVHEASKAAVSGHEENGAHPKIEKRLEGVEIKQEAIRDSQIRQEGTDKSQSDALDDIKDDLKYIKRQVR